MDLKNVKHIGFPRLPAEYQEVEYLATAADGYIDSGFAFTQPELKIEFKYLKEDNLLTSLFGVDFGSDSENRLMHGHINGNKVYVGNSGRTITIPEGKQELEKLYEGSVQLMGTEIDEQKIILTLNGETLTKINGEDYFFGGCPYSDLVFASRRYPEGYGNDQFRGRLYYLRFYDHTGNEVRNFIPCYRKSDGTTGLYDLCGSVCPQPGTPFYENLTSGRFQKGPSVAGYQVKQIHKGDVLLWEEKED